VPQFARQQVTFKFQTVSVRRRHFGARRCKRRECGK